jgi:lysophosphatidylcholine acyltransferase/lyso-PAF acetyltransferase
MFNFPAEGTTTNGDFLLPFKTGAFLARVPVLPVILRYPYKRFSPAWDSIAGVSVSLQTLTFLAFNSCL